MTEAEVLEYIRDQFHGADGFVARLARGEGLDEEAVGSVRHALDSLRIDWAHRTLVHKADVRPFVDVWMSIHASARLYPGRESSIEILADELSSNVRRVFLNQSGPRSEEEAMATIWAHFGGVYSFLLAMHERSGLDREAIEEVTVALDTLEHAWSERADIPKSIVGPMLDVRSSIMQNAGWYPNDQAEIFSLAGDLADRVRRCLG